ncbi:MAG: NUDIX domain-containing protein [Clostridiaceae bacterium]|nr:NUDIX domain-containing protein [Clostridiaceae bacterium]
METILMNMVRIFKGDEVLVLDKKINEGWEGLTFPGGKMEPFETFEEAAIREIKEETNLNIRNLRYDGTIVWYESNRRLVGMLYTTSDFSGDLITIGDEGKLFFQNYLDFLKVKEKSDSMEDILSIYNHEYREIYIYFDQAGSVTHKKKLI